MVLATQNPIENEGTYPLPEAQLDRFLFKLLIEFPSLEELKQIMHLTVEGQQEQIQPVLTAGDLMEMRQVVRDIPGVGSSGGICAGIGDRNTSGQ